ncbi:MAG: glutathione S-transferase family protein [Deltaproteobacteria bacterium]|nr:MAG: glutathione S-transferase family protein [Deltaproteobacteria bacterium]
MSDRYRIFGSELSPYSIKVRAYFRYKQIPHEWVTRSRENMVEFQQHAKLPLIPLVLTPDGGAMQDSTPIIEKMEELFPEPSIHPENPALGFLSALIEEYGDEWGNKPMFHYRWTYEADQESASQRIAADNAPGASDAELKGIALMIRRRMIPRLSFVGSSDETRDQLERSYRRQLSLLEQHLAARPYLFGARPAFADFGLAPQIYEAGTDPTPAAILDAEAPRVRAWVERMLDPKNEGDFERWDALGSTLLPLLKEEVAGVFLPWSDANARALKRGDKEFSIELEGRPFSQNTQKYHARSLGVLRARYAAVSDKSELDPILKQANCLDWM